MYLRFRPNAEGIRPSVFVPGITSSDGNSVVVDSLVGQKSVGLKITSIVYNRQLSSAHWFDHLYLYKATSEMCEVVFSLGFHRCIFL